MTNKFFIVSILALSLLSFANNASAANVNYDLGTVAIGDTGVLVSNHPDILVTNNIAGSLPSNSMITFSYNFGGSLLSGYLSAGADYSYLMDGDSFNGGALNTSPTGINYSFGTVNGVSSTPLVMASAQIDTATTGTTVITNNSGGLGTFASVFQGLIAGNNDVTVAYSVSAVPLPAALPLFGAGLSALGFGAWRRRKAAA